MNHDLKKITRAGIGALIFALVLGLALVQPAKADEKLDQIDFVDDCNLGVGFGDGVAGTVTVAGGTQLGSL